MQRVIETAKKEVGYLEKATADPTYLSRPQANPGHNNYTIYAAELDAIPGFYNGPKQGYPWCDVFVDCMFVRAYGAEMAKRLLCQPAYSCGAGCLFSMRYYQAAGQFFKSPEVGDQIFFKSGDNICHTGLVIDVDGSYVYTIEGNTSSTYGIVSNGGSVREKKYLLGHSGIAGYGRPDYSLLDQAASSSDKQDEDTESHGSDAVFLPNLKDGSVGQTVKAMQLLLIGSGSSCGRCGADGEFGSGTRQGVSDYQYKNGLPVSGVCDTATWKKLLGVTDHAVG